MDVRGAVELDPPAGGLLEELSRGVVYVRTGSEWHRIDPIAEENAVAIALEQHRNTLPLLGLAGHAA